MFGVGGGIVIVPLLVLWLGYEQREATGTSLAAIVVIAAVTAALQALYGNVDFAKGVLIGVPAVFGACHRHTAAAARPRPLDHADLRGPARRRRGRARGLMADELAVSRSACWPESSRGCSASAAARCSRRRS